MSIVSMKPGDEIDFQDENEVEQAYLAAKAGRELFGELVRPWTPSRAVAAQTMGMIFPMIGEAGQESFKLRQTYAGILQDVVIVCWLCTLPDEAAKNGSGWTPSRALRNPSVAFEMAVAWAGDNKMTDMGSDAFQDGLRLFLGVHFGEAASNFKVEVEGSSEQPEGDSGKV